MPAPPSASLHARRAHSAEQDPLQALLGLRQELEADSASAVLLFCSGDYDLDVLGPAIAVTFSAPVVACTTAGQIGPGGFRQGGITGVSLRSSDLSMKPHLFAPLSSCRSQAVSIAREHAANRCWQHSRSFGLLLIDGLSLAEEFVASALYEALGNVPVVGGSAAPARPGQVATVYHEGKFHAQAAVVALFETSSLELAAFNTQHFVPSDKKLVITLADPERRLVHEINGEPAARAYARALGVDERALTQLHFACHPLMLDLGDELLPRAIRARDPSGSLLLACAIEDGLVVSIAASLDPLRTLQASLERVTERVPAPEALIVFNCIARRTELEARGLAGEVGALLDRYGAVGFSGWGEQHGPIHRNHTLTGIALGPPRAGGHAR